MAEMNSRSVGNKFHELPINNEEISLVDLFLILLKRKKLIAFVTLGITAIGLFYGWSIERQYQYSLSVEVGSIRIANSNTVSSQLLETPGNVLAKLKNSYIPVVLQTYREENPGDENNYVIEVTLPKGSNHIQLNATGVIENQKTYALLMQRVVERLVKDHNQRSDIIRSQLEKEQRLLEIELNELEDDSTWDVRRLEIEKKLIIAKTTFEELNDPRVTEVPKRELEIKLAAEQAKLSALSEQTSIYKSQYQRLDQVEVLLKKRIKELSEQVKSAMARRQNALSRVDNEVMAMAMLMIDNEIQQNRDRLAVLENQLYIGLEKQREELTSKLNGSMREKDLQRKYIQAMQGKLDKLLIDNERASENLEPEIALLNKSKKKLAADQHRAIAKKKEIVRSAERKIADMRPTRPISDVLRSWQPVGSGGKTVVMLAVLLGIMLAIFSAFFAEFIARVKARMAGDLLRSNDIESDDELEYLDQNNSKIKGIVKVS